MLVRDDILRKHGYPTSGSDGWKLLDPLGGRETDAILRSVRGSLDVPSDIAKLRFVGGIRINRSYLGRSRFLPELSASEGCTASIVPFGGGQEHLSASVKGRESSFAAKAPWKASGELRCLRAGRCVRNPRSSSHVTLQSGNRSLRTFWRKVGGRSSRLSSVRKPGPCRRSALERRLPRCPARCWTCWKRSTRQVPEAGPSRTSSTSSNALFRLAQASGMACKCWR